MLKKIKIKNIYDYLKQIDARDEKGVYFYKITFYNKEIETFLKSFLNKVKENGLYIKDGLKNPDLNDINYIIKIIGNDFKIQQSFFEEKLKKWLPQLSIKENKDFSYLMYNTLEKLKEEGKNIDILRNVYIKFMYWSYYKFQYIIKKYYESNGKELSKILFEGSITKYEALYLNIISQLGCDILILEYFENKNSKEILNIELLPKNSFPEKFTLEKLMLEMNREERLKNNILEEKKKNIKWMSQNIFEDVLKSILDRGKEKDISYSVFAKILGVEDINKFELDLLTFSLKIKEQEREFVLIENGINNPEYDEVIKIKKPQGDVKENILLNLTRDISFSSDVKKNKCIQSVFIKTMLEIEEEKLQKFLNRTIIILCWLNRYLKLLKGNIKKYYPIFLYYGSCNNINEQIFLKLLSKLDIDVIIICPDKNKNFILKDEFLVEKIYENSLPIGQFPKNTKDLKLKTVAAKAEKDLENILYTDTGLYKINQFKKSESITLKTTYEEIKILWQEEAKYRPNFKIVEDLVIIPNICAKVTGVPNKDINTYWKNIEDYIQEEEYFIVDFPIFNFDKNNIFNTRSFYNNGRLDFERIKQNKKYRYSFIKEDVQNYILEKIQSYLKYKNIKSIDFKSGENEILQILLNLDIELLRKIQNFDFTKKIPKIVILDTKEDIGKIEDAIVVEFLKEIGFDILLLVPTGYRSLESYFSKNIFIEHQIGEYMYDLKIPKFNKDKKKFNINKINFKTIFNIFN